MKRNGFRLV